MHTIYRYRRVLGWISAPLLLPLFALGQEAASSTELAPSIAVSSSPSGTVQATLEHDEISGTWSLHVNGSFEGAGTKITAMQLFGTDANGKRLADPQPLDPMRIPAASPFAKAFEIPKPDPRWMETALELTLSDGTDSATVQSSLFPIIWQQPVLIDHAIGGSIVTAPNYEAGGVPDGIGIPHALLNGIPDGDYFAVVFFDQAKGCPSDYYHLNAFEPRKIWGADERPLGPYVFSADSTAGGGCMQEFHIDPAKNGDWLWGALSSTGTSSAIADASGIPAFAVCATAAACDPIVPHAAIDLPPETTATSSAISNVLFLPGIKGSELYEDNPLCLIPSDSCGIKIWLPLADLSVPELFLDADGKSKKDVFVRQGALLESALGHSFYASFTESLDHARAAGIFGAGWDWRAVAYDWRLSLPDIVQNGARRGSHVYFDETPDEPYLERTLRSLASSSPTGKVTIVAHSNGGLVAKALMRSLGDTLSAQLIDSVIFVGAPQSGAPRAIGALLFGDAEGIPGIPHVPDLIMSAAHAREFGLNSPMAYHLLPSARYMSAFQPEHPVLAFDGHGIRTETELKSFALAKDDGRSMPDPADLTAPNILNPTLYEYAESEHALIDSWEPPSGIEVYELGGYGADTISGIDLYTSAHRDGSTSLSYRPLFTSDGDGTVPIISALMMNAAAHVHQIWLDLPSMNGSYSHANLLEAPDVQATIEDILRGSEAYPASAHAMEAPLPVSRKQLGFYVHSPVSLTVLSSSGLKTSVTEDGTEERILGSTAGMLGEVKYVLVPAGQPYTLLLKGEREGTFTLDLQELDDGAVTASSTIADVPVESGANGSITLTNGLASASPLAIDEDNDGTVDVSIEPVLGATVFPDASASAATADNSIGRVFSAQKSRPILRALAPLPVSTTSIDATASSSPKSVPAALKHVGPSAGKQPARSRQKVSMPTSATHAVKSAPHHRLFGYIKAVLQAAVSRLASLLFKTLSGLRGW